MLVSVSQKVSVHLQTGSLGLYPLSQNLFSSEAHPSIYNLTLLHLSFLLMRAGGMLSGF